MTDLRARLQAVLGDAYQIERELGGGGMSRLFVATEGSLHRQVVIKLLPPEFASEVSAARFKQEIELAAHLQHPNILPLLTAGAKDDLLFYVMPFVAGESLRHRITREGKLPIAEAVRILHEVADALACAHAEGVIHRDVKPENILLLRSHAVLMDFGVARAVAVSHSGGRLTDTGIAVGTPAYMSPEQAAGEPNIDASADVYALAVVGYEMLAGVPPFAGPTAQAVIAAHMTAAPRPLRELRPDTPLAIEQAVARALVKDRHARLRTAEFRDAIAVPAAHPRRPASVLRVVGLYALAAVAVLGVVYILTMQLGLPNWVVSSAAILLIVGLPIMVLTGLIERWRAAGQTSRAQWPVVGRLRNWLTWRKALVGGGVAFATLGLGTTLYMAMRLLGIGPLGTLVASGVIKNKEPLILATFSNQTADPTLGRALTEAFRIDLSESPTVKLVDPQVIASALQRMERSPATPLDAPLAREIAQRENVKAVVTGEVDPVGTGYLLSASLVAAADGRVLTAVRETAANDGALIVTLDRLSRRLRERIGESLRSIRTTEPLEQVTTRSLEALRKYSEAVRADAAGEYPREFALYKEAVAIDTGFAMAYRRIATMLSGAGDSPAAIVQATTKAFARRDRLPEIERSLATGLYYQSVEYDPQQAAMAYRSVLERDPDNAIALGNLNALLLWRRQWEAGESLAIRRMRLPLLDARAFGSLAIAQAFQGRDADARATVARFAEMAPRHPALPYVRALLDGLEGDYAAGERDYRQLQTNARDDDVLQSFASSGLAEVNETRGKLRQAARDVAAYMANREQRGQARDYLVGAAWLAALDVRYRSQPLVGLRRVEAALSRHPLSTIAPLDRPYSALAVCLAAAGRPGGAQQLLTEYERLVPQGIRRGDAQRLQAAGAIALAEGRAQDAVVAYRAWNNEAFGAQQGSLFELATAFERAHQPDSALGVYEQVVSTPALFLIPDNAYALAPTLRRLGQLYEARGERAKAREYYGRFVDLWRDADPELQPIVATARAALKQLSSEPR